MPQLPYQLPSGLCAVLIQSIACFDAVRISSTRYFGYLLEKTERAVTPVRFEFLIVSSIRIGVRQQRAYRWTGHTSSRALDIRVLDHDVGKHFRRIEEFEQRTATDQLVRCEPSARVLQREDRVDRIAQAFVRDPFRQVPAPGTGAG